MELLYESLQTNNILLTIFYKLQEVDTRNLWYDSHYETCCVTGHYINNVENVDITSTTTDNYYYNTIVVEEFVIMSMIDCGFPFIIVIMKLQVI